MVAADGLLDEDPPDAPVFGNEALDDAGVVDPVDEPVAVEDCPKVRTTQIKTTSRNTATVRISIFIS